jgi:hypothetical protein
MADRRKNIVIICFKHKLQVPILYLYDALYQYALTSMYTLFLKNHEMTKISKSYS